MDVLVLLLNTVLLRPYVFLFLAAFLVAGRRLLGWQRTLWFLGLTWLTAFICEFSSTRIGVPFGWYYYTGSTVGRELYLSNVPFMDSLSFAFLLFASYALALWFLLPGEPTSAWPWVGFRSLPACGRSAPVAVLTVVFFVFIDVVIDPVALRGDRWFLGQIYGYPEPGIYFGVPIANFVGWAVVGTLSLAAYFLVDRRLPPLAEQPTDTVGRSVLLGCGLYYAVLLFNLAVTFWIDERLIGMAGVLIYLPLTVLFLLRPAGLARREGSPAVACPGPDRSSLESS